MTNNNTLGLSPTNLSSEYIDINKTDITIATELYASVNSKEYQVFLDRFRRKDGENYTSNEKSNNKSSDSNDDSNGTKTNPLGHIYEKLSLTIGSLELVGTKDAEKLKIDDATRTKIFHDYYSTVNKVNRYNDNEPNTNDTLTLDILDYNETIDILFNETEIPEADTKIRRRFSNDSLVYPDNLSSPHAPSFTRMQTPKPALVEGKIDKKELRFIFVGNKI